MVTSIPQTVGSFVRGATKRLQEAGVTTARLDSLVLLEDELDKDRAWLLANPEFSIPSSSLRRLHTLVSKRATHIPLAYIRGKSEFYGREFKIDTHTLVPRPETEALIDLLRTLPLAPGTRLIDVGTGSGCIAITAALELPKLAVSACDIDDKCLTVAARNADNLHAAVTFLKSDLLKKTDDFDVLAANLPYVPTGFQINIAATHEPRRAIFGGTDGLQYYRNLFHQITARQHRPRYVVIESLPFQHKELTATARAAGFTIVKTDDFIQLFKQI